MSAHHDRSAAASIQEIEEQLALAAAAAHADDLLADDLSDELPNEDAPRDLLPWADPYIARLVRQHELQCAERRRLRQPYNGEPTLPFPIQGQHPAPTPDGAKAPRRVPRVQYRRLGPSTPAR